MTEDVIKLSLEQALNLAVEAKIINKATVELMLMKAQREAMALESASKKE